MTLVSPYNVIAAKLMATGTETISWGRKEREMRKIDANGGRKTSKTKQKKRNSRREKSRERREQQLNSRRTRGRKEINLFSVHTFLSSSSSSPSIQIQRKQKAQEFSLLFSFLLRHIITLLSLLCVKRETNGGRTAHSHHFSHSVSQVL